MANTVNPLLSTQKPSDSSLQVALHPLPILEISDHITRAYQRGQNGAIVGALLGQQNGREITIEHSFTFKTTTNEAGQYFLESSWFESRLEQMKLVHKDPPPLDLVGWYTLVPKTGPTPDHLPIHNQILKGYNESAVLLGFHTEDVLAPVAGDPLPLTIYESNLEAKDEGREGGHAASEDREMKDPDAAPQMVLRFRELPFTTETGDAEMIAMQFIREGGANATAQASQKPAAPASTPAQAPASGAKGKHRDAAAEASADSHNDVLSKEESEQISALQAKANAIKMMKSRLDLIITYLEKLPPGSVTGSGAAAAAAGTHQGVTLSNNILRQIRALVTNVELVTLSHQDTLQAEILQESNDVALIGLVKDLMTSINEVRDVGKKFFVAELNKTQRSRMGHFDGKGGPSFPVGSAMEFL